MSPVLSSGSKVAEVLPRTGSYSSRAIVVRTGTICGGTEWIEHLQVVHPGRASDHR